MNWKFDFSPETSDIFAVLALGVDVWRYSKQKKPWTEVKPDFRGKVRETEPRTSVHTMPQDNIKFARLPPHPSFSSSYICNRSSSPMPTDTETAISLLIRPKCFNAISRS